MTTLVGQAVDAFVEAEAERDRIRHEAEARREADRAELVRTMTEAGRHRLHRVTGVRLDIIRACTRFVDCRRGPLEVVLSVIEPGTDRDEGPVVHVAVRWPPATTVDEATNTKAMVVQVEGNVGGILNDRGHIRSLEDLGRAIREAERGDGEPDEVSS